MKHIICLLLLSLFSSSILAEHSGTRVPQEVREFFSFENDFEGWNASGVDLSADAWSIMRTQEMSKDGATSLKLDLTNDNDAGKIWVERPFTVQPNQIYHVSIRYALASRDSGIGDSTVITGVLKKSPTTRIDLIPTFKDTTNNFSESNVGFRWTKRKYEFTVRSDENGILNVVIGIWATFEVRKIYYLDSLSVTFTKKPEGSEFYSFENDMEGWNAYATDLESTGGSEDWSITPSQEIWEDGSTSLKLDLDNLNGKGKIWIERPFTVEPKKKYLVTVDYAFSSDDHSHSPRFTIITGVLRAHSQTSEDLVTSYQDDTSSEMFSWLHKSYEFTVKSKKSDTLYVVIGIWGTEQAHRTYWFDSACVNLTKQ